MNGKRKTKIQVRLGALLLVLGAVASAAAGAQTTMEWEIRVSANGAAIRLKPDPDSPIVSRAAKGSTYRSYEKEGDWFRVIVEPGPQGLLLFGYLASGEVEIVKQKVREASDFWSVNTGEFHGLGLTVKLVGGLNFFKGGDLRPGLDGLIEKGRRSMIDLGYLVRTERKEALHNNVEIGGDVLYEITRRIGLGFNFRYIHFYRDYLQEIQAPSTAWTSRLISAYSLTALAYGLNLYYTIPVNALLDIVLLGGPMIFDLDYNFTRTNGLYYGLDDLLQSSRQRKTGFQGGAVLEFNLNNRGAIVLEVVGRSAKFVGPSGTEQLTRWGVYDRVPVGPEIRGPLVFLEGDAVPRFSVTTEGTAAGSFRPAVIDLSGISILAGLRLRF